MMPESLTYGRLDWFADLGDTTALRDVAWVEIERLRAERDALAARLERAQRLVEAVQRWHENEDSSPLTVDTNLMGAWDAYQDAPSTSEGGS